VTADCSVAAVTEDDLGDLLPLMRAYCNFYAVAPSDGELLALSRSLIADPAHEGVQLLARRADGVPIGFATLFWTWSTLVAGRIGVMNDLYVVPEARGRRVGEALIEACRKRCQAHGARSLTWQTARDNSSAQALYDRTGAEREQWVDYTLDV
jgi:GNAT superfamily N-acetyltransferase